MTGARVVRDAHEALCLPLSCVEAVENYTRLAVASDFVATYGLTRWQFEHALKTMDAVLANPSVDDADIKGMLNRIDIGWSMQSPFGARAHLKAARDEIAAWIEKK